MAAPLVEFRSVVKRFDDFVAVDGVSFTIEAGEFVAKLIKNRAWKIIILNWSRQVITNLF